MGKSAAENAGQSIARQRVDAQERRADAVDRRLAWERLRAYAAHIVAVLIVVIGAFDCVSTDLALSTGHAVELNPIVRWMQEVCGPLWVWPKMTIHAFLALALLSAPSRAALVAMILVSMLTLIAAINNMTIYQTYSGLPL